MERMAPRSPTSVRRARVAVGLLLLGGLAAAGPAAAQDPSETFSEEIEVRVVNLEVVVTDEDGQRVTGLPAAAFLVRVDGEEMPISHFSEIRDEGSPGGGAASGERESTEEGATARTPATPAAPGTSFLVFIDDHVTLERNRDFVLERLRGELPQLGPGDRMAIVAYDGRELEVLEGWSASTEKLDTALERAMRRPADGIRWVAYARMSGFVANWIGNATRRSVLAAAASLRIVPAPPGRKALILVAGSWDPSELVRAGDFAQWCVTGPCRGLYAFTALVDTANELGYSIYAVDVEGRDVQGSWEREKRLQETLAAIAEHTGGRALLNTDRRRMLSLTAADSRSYYSLGFTAKAALGSRHRIEVEMTEPGLVARSRKSFVAAPRQRTAELEAFSRLIAGGSAQSSAFPVEVGEPDLGERRRMRFPVSVFVPVDEIAWLGAPGRLAARLHVQLAWVDPRENSGVENWEVTLERGAAPSPGHFEHLEFELDLTRRRHDVLVRVLDLNGAADLYRRIELAPPSKKR